MELELELECINVSHGGIAIQQTSDTTPAPTQGPLGGTLWPLPP